MIHRDVPEINNLSEEVVQEGVNLQSPPDPVVLHDPYMNPEFTRILIEHMHRAKIAALADEQE